MAETNTHHLEWQAPEFRHYEKSVGWYALLYTVVGLLTLYQIFRADYFGAVTMVIIAVLISFFARRKPAIVTVKLDDENVTLGELKIPYRHFKHFWIVDTNDHKTLNLEASTYLKQTIIVELMDEDPEKVRKLVSRHITEAEASHPSFSQRIAHRFRF